jgi:ABC-2 type transport system ATP-binding protein
MIEIERLSKRFGATRAIDDISLTVPAGAVTTVLGLNGAGKSTLLRLIAGFEQPDLGQIRICGKSLPRERDPMQLLGMQFAAAAMDPRHTVSRQLRWLAALGGIGSATVAAVLDRIGLTASGATKIGALSDGARQRLGIGCALLGDPQVLIFDEPANALDVAGIVWLRNLLRDLASDGRTVVQASHLLGEVVLTTDRVVMIADGRIVADGPLSQTVPDGVDARTHLEQALTPAAVVPR